MFYFSAACGDDAPSQVVTRWVFESASPLAPPAIGPERRVAIAKSSGTGELATVNEENGLKVEEPFPIFATEHAPVAVGASFAIVSTIGKVVAYNLAGEPRFTQPEGAPLLETSPLVRAPDGSLRIATTAGRVLGFDGTDGVLLFDAAISGAVTTPPAVASDGTTYVATDTGKLFGVRADGTVDPEVDVTAPASGPSVSASGGELAVGEGDAVRVVDREGAEIFKHTRAARVVGTRWTAQGELLAWGEDGIVELLDKTGATVWAFNAGHPVYAEVVPLDQGGYAVFDSTGVVHRVTKDGASDATITLAGAPLPQIAKGELGWLYVAVGNTVVAIDFDLE